MNLGAYLTQPLAPGVKKKIFLYLGIETMYDTSLILFFHSVSRSYYEVHIDILGRT